MNTRLLAICLSMFLLLPKFSFSAVVSRIVGSIGEEFLTSREVLASRWIEVELFGAEWAPENLDFNSVKFNKIVNEGLLEKVIAIESTNFTLAQITDEEINQSSNVLLKKLSENKDWKNLQIDAIEFKELLSNKLKVKKFLKYKTETATLGVTDEEVKGYYDKNRYKFGNMPFSQFKDTIRHFLVKQQMEERLKEWFEILKKKYKVKNLLPRNTN